MIENSKQTSIFSRITIVYTVVYMQGCIMFTIGKIPTITRLFFKPIKTSFSAHVYNYFCPLVVAMCISHGSTLERLVNLLRNSTHRTNHGEFMSRCNFDETKIVPSLALNTLKKLYKKGVKDCLLIIDDTQTIKRAKKMDAVGKIHHHASGKYCYGHTILKACIFYRGVTIPLASSLYVKKEHTAQLDIPFKKLTALAAELIDKADIPAKFDVTVLFDAFYLCSEVANACKRRKWRYIGVSKSNRWLKVNSRRHKIGKYGKNVLRRQHRWYNIKGLKKTCGYKLAGRVGTMNKLGKVKVVFSKRRNDSSIFALVTNDTNMSMKKVVSHYLKRWAIEVMIKEQKQHMGLGDYRLLRYKAIVRHLCLVDSAYACLTHIGIKDQSAQGDKKDTKDMLTVAPISSLKARMRKIIWHQEVENVIKISHDKKVVRRLEKLLAA